jgi:ABC-type Zn uptake system ZnuABC Zn-binding protein ZnuA
MVGVFVRIGVLVSAVCLVFVCTACQATQPPSAIKKKSIIVTYSILGSVVKQLVEDKANVIGFYPKWTGSA